VWTWASRATWWSASSRLRKHCLVPLSMTVRKRCGDFCETGTIASRCQHTFDGKLKWSRLGTGANWPKVKTEAAQTGHLVRFALHLATEYNSHNEHGELRLGVCQLLQGRFASADARGELCTVSGLFQTMYAELRRAAIAIKALEDVSEVPSVRSHVSATDTSESKKYVAVQR